MSDKEIDTFIAKHKTYETTFEVEFFKKFGVRIIKRQLDKMSDAEIDAFIATHRKYETTFEIEFFKRFGDRIVKANPRSFIQVRFINNGNEETKAWKLDGGLVRKVIDYYENGM